MLSAMDFGKIWMNKPKVGLYTLSNVHNGLYLNMKIACEWAVQFLLLKHVMLVMCPASLILIYEDTNFISTAALRVEEMFTYFARKEKQTVSPPKLYL